MTVYIHWERAGSRNIVNMHEIGMSERFRRLMEDASFPVDAVPEVLSPRDGSMGHYGLLFEGTAVSPLPDGISYRVHPQKYLGIVCHKRSVVYSIDKAKKAAKELGMEYKGKTF